MNSTECMINDQKPANGQNYSGIINNDAGNADTDRRALCDYGSKSPERESILRIDQVHIYNFQSTANVEDDSTLNQQHNEASTERSPSKCPIRDDNEKKLFCSSPEEIKICPPSKRRSSSGRSSTTKRSSSTGSSGYMCRICHENDICEELLSPCDCAGSMGLVHASCVEIWLETSNKNSCEICKKLYRVVKTPRSFFQWLSSEPTSMQHRNRIGDMICFVLLLPVAISSSYLCLQAVATKSVWENQWEAGGLIFLTGFFISAFVVWTVVSIRYHYEAWRKWRSVNQIIHLVTGGGDVQKRIDQDESVFIRTRSSNRIESNRINTSRNPDAFDDPVGTFFAHYGNVNPPH